MILKGGRRHRFHQLIQLQPKNDQRVRLHHRLQGRASKHRVPLALDVEMR